MKYSLSIYGILTIIWFILLTLCGLIGILIVPIDNQMFINLTAYLISISKVLISSIAIIAWLLFWYKSMNYILSYELSKNSSWIHNSKFLYFQIIPSKLFLNVKITLSFYLPNINKTNGHKENTSKKWFSFSCGK